MDVWLQPFSSVTDQRSSICHITSQQLIMGCDFLLNNEQGADILGLGRVGAGLLSSREAPVSPDLRGQTPKRPASLC